MNSTYLQEIETAVETLRKAMIEADEAVLTQLASDKLSYGHSAGKIQNKEQFVASIAGGTSVFEALEITDQTIVFHDDTAVVRHILSGETNDRGKGAATIKLGILLVWVKEDEAWKLLARQAVKVQ
ncbi:MAG: nuclear transport factor 2 family protein [Sphingobacteriaceae bacterium]|nr:MAG: nuclear transport factor 2 family protein [Sphingobacteriaceae bacterium]